MTEVENALRIIWFNSPERIVSRLPIYNIEFHNRRDEPYVHGQTNTPLGPGRSMRDIWGVVTTRKYDAVGALHSEPSLTDPAQLAGFQWPDPDDDWICAKFHQQAADFPGGDLWISGGHSCAIWEIAYKMIGMERLLEYFYSEPEFVREVFHRIVDFHLGIARQYVQLGVRSVGFSDDLATQSGPFFSPDILEEFFKPEYKRLFGFYREHDVIVGMHCDGNVDRLLDFFMEVGLNILNPVQVTANDLAAVRRKTQGRLCLHGGISNVTVSRGPVEAIEAEVHRHIWMLGQQGGFFPNLDHSMPTPEAHRRAFVEAVEKWGRFPLVPPPECSSSS